MAEKAELERWWDGLTEEERNDAIRSRHAGQLSEAMEKSLEKAGLIPRGKREDRSIPGDVDEFLDEQDVDDEDPEDLDEQGGDQGDGPLLGGKMRH